MKIINPMAKYRYPGLNRHAQLVRLLRLKRGNYDDEIRCAMFEVNFDVASGGVPFEALSYTWGGSERNVPISVNRRAMLITRNLDIAMRHIRYRNKDRILWIDAICIDQENKDERQHQVRQMSEIYRKAEGVLVWLGLSTYKTDSVMDLMQVIQTGSRFNQSTWKIEAHFWEDIGVENACFPLTPGTLQYRGFSKSAERAGLQELLNRPWFERVWILQEIGNARAATIICGRKSVSARTFALLPMILGAKPTEQQQAVLDIMPGVTREKSWFNDLRDLSILLRRFKNCKASDPRDKIYALLGIATDPTNHPFLQPDYKKPLDQVVREATAYLLND